MGQTAVSFSRVQPFEQLLPPNSRQPPIRPVVSCTLSMSTGPSYTIPSSGSILDGTYQASQTIRPDPFTNSITIPSSGSILDGTYKPSETIRPNPW